MSFLFGTQITRLCFEFIVRRCKRDTYERITRNDKCLLEYSGEYNCKHWYPHQMIEIKIPFCVVSQIHRSDDMPESICSVCLRKLIATNVFRKQCLSTDFELRKMQNDHNERKLLEEIENRMHVQIDTMDDLTETSDIENMNLIEYIEEEAYDGCETDEIDDIDTDKIQHVYEELKVELVSDDGLHDNGDSYLEECVENASTIASNDEYYKDDQDDQDDDDNDDDNVSNLESSLVARNEIRSSGGKRERKMCPVCGKMVVNLKPHIETHQKRENRRKPYVCSYCNKQFLQRAQYDGHVNKEHTGEKPFKCDQCDKRFHGRPTLRMHKIQHSNERRFACEFCDKRYRYAHHLSHHRYTHTQGRQFHCDQCNYTNVHRENLRRHIHSHHPQPLTEQHPFVIYMCTMCDRHFNGKSNMLRHQKLFHKIP